MILKKCIGTARKRTDRESHPSVCFAMEHIHQSYDSLWPFRKFDFSPCRYLTMNRLASTSPFQLLYYLVFAMSMSAILSFYLPDLNCPFCPPLPAVTTPLQVKSECKALSSHSPPTQLASCEGLQSPAAIICLLR